MQACSTLRRRAAAQAQITAAGAGTTVHAEATRSRPWSDLQIAAFGGVGVLTRTTELEHPRGTWRINRSA
jgi:hypothetical protein